MFTRMIPTMPLTDRYSFLMMILSALSWPLSLGPNGANAADPRSLPSTGAKQSAKTVRGDVIRLTNGQWVFRLHPIHLPGDGGGGGGSDMMPPILSAD